MAVRVTQRVIAEDYYIYDVRFTNLLRSPFVGSRQIGFIQIERDSDFLVQKLAYFINDFTGSTKTIGTTLFPFVTVLITDTGSGRQLSNNPVPITAMMGDGRLPYVLPTPKLFPKSARMSIAVENLESSLNYNDLQIQFEGKKIFVAG